jgi:hypothetical protein
MAKSFYSSSKSNHNQGSIPKVNPLEPRPFEELPSLHSPQEEENKQQHNSQQSPSPSHNDLSHVSIFAPSNSIQTQLTEKSPQNQEIEQKNNSKTNFSQSPPISPFPPNTPNNQNFQNNSIIQGYYGENNPNSPIQRKRFNIPASEYIDPYAVINKNIVVQRLCSECEKEEKNKLQAKFEDEKSDDQVEKSTFTVLPPSPTEEGQENTDNTPVEGKENPVQTKTEETTPITAPPTEDEKSTDNTPVEGKQTPVETKTETTPPVTAPAPEDEKSTDNTPVEGKEVSVETETETTPVTASSH